MNYIIRNFDESFGQLTIEFGDMTFAFDVPIDENNNYIVGETLDEQIKGLLPIWHIERKNKIAAGVGNVDVLKSMVQPYPEPEVTLQTSPEV